MTNQENQDNSTASSDAEMLDLLDVKDIHDGMWMKVKYNREIFLGKVLSVVNNETQVDALNSHLGYCNHKKEDAVFYETVCATDVNPVMIKHGKNECGDTETRYSLLSRNMNQFKLKEKDF